MKMINFCLISSFMAPPSVTISRRRIEPAHFYAP
jgi:hypothetical protein